MLPGRHVAVVALALLAATCVPARAATVQISMENMQISPTEMSAKVGDTVEWTNNDVVVHTATARNGDFDLTLPAKKSASTVLKKAGTVDYYCRYHPNMKASLKVEP
jgi:plastocyanin